MQVSFLKLARAIGLFLGWGSLALGAVTTWTPQTSGTTQDLWGVCASPATIVAVGTGGAVLTSPDGVHWMSQQSGTSVWLVAVAYSPPLSLFVAVGDQGVILTSPDGVAWTQRASGGARLNGVACASGFPTPSEKLLVAVGEGGTLLGSDDGITWTPGSSQVTGWLHGIACSSNGYLMVGQSAAMELLGDGLAAQPLNPQDDRDIEGAAAGPYLALAVGANGYLGSAFPGVWNWTRFLAPGAPHFQAAAIGGTSGEDFAVGLQGAVELGYSSQLGLSWVPSVSGTSEDLYGVTWFPGSSGLAIAVGQGGTILTSPYEAGPPSSTGIVAPATPAFGSSVTLIGQAPAGIAPFAYQWFFNGQAIAGATSASYTVPSAALASNGQYSLTITNAAGSQTLSSTLAATAQAAISGLVDESFNPAQLSIPPLTVAVQSDGKVLVGGNSVSRLNVDGSPDASFNQNSAAISIPDAWGFHGGFSRVLPLANGQAIIAGSGVTGGTAKAPFTLSYRLNSEGTNDPAYAPTVQSNPFAASDIDLPEVPTVDGRFFTVVLSSAGLPMITRLTSAGALDPAWTAYAPPGAFSVSSARLQPDAQGRMLLVAGDPTISADGAVGRTFVCRVNSDGSFDSTFTPQTFGGGVALFPQASGAVVYENGATPLGTSPDQTGTLTVGRLTVLGEKDASYAGLSLPIEGSSTTTKPTWVTGPSLLPADGSLYLDLAPGNVGSAPMPLLNGTYRDGFIRIDPNGNLDLSYSLNIDLRAGSGAGSLSGAVAAPNGQWLLWGNFTSFNGEPRTDLVRINPQVGSNFAGLVNLSARAAAGAGDQALAVGFVTNGGNSTGVLLRGIGPGLAQFGVTAARWERVRRC